MSIIIGYNTFSPKLFWRRVNPLNRANVQSKDEIDEIWDTFDGLAFEDSWNGSYSGALARY